MKLYLAGPMMSKEFFNFPEFHRVARKLRAAGFSVFNPADKETLAGTDLPDPTKLPMEWGGKHPTLTPQDIFREDLEAIMGVEGIVLLPGWAKSKGSLHECHVARRLGLTIFTLQGDNMLIELDPTYDFPVVLTTWREDPSNPSPPHWRRDHQEPT